VSNGRRIFNGVDGRSIEARRFRDLIAALAADLGGLDSLTEAERTLVRHTASLAVRSEQLQAAVLKGEAVDPTDLIRLTDAVAGVLDRLRRIDPEHKEIRP
jgi:hypothetical protein